MKIPSVRKILKEDLPDAPDWINGVISPINSFMEYMYQAMNRNITDSDNIACSVKELTYITPSTYPVMDNVEFASGLKFKATGLTLLQILDKSDFSPPTSAVYVPWIDDDGVIVIYPIIGLAASKSYILRVRVS